MISKKNLDVINIDNNKTIFLNRVAVIKHQISILDWFLSNSWRKRLTLFCLVNSCRFTPDFTSSRVIRELKLVTAGGSVFAFVLNASLPYHMLALCAETLPRPNWELELYIIVSLVMRSDLSYLIT